MQYIFLNGLFDSNNFLFSHYGDDYHYINNFKYYKNSVIKFSGLAVNGDVTPYNLFLYYIINLGGLRFYIFIEIFLYVISNYFFYQISRRVFSQPIYSTVALAIFLILPLRYVWLFSFYKDSLILSLSIIFIYLHYYKNSKSAFISFIPLFFLRPITASALLLVGVNHKKIYKILFVFIPVSLIGIYFLRDYLYFFRDERIIWIQDKLTEIPFNSSGRYNLFMPIILWLISMIQPLYRSMDQSLVYSIIDVPAKFDAFIKLILIPPTVHGFFSFRKHLKNNRISLVFKLLCSLSFILMISFMFLTNRHFIVFLPWQIIFAIYMIEINGYKLVYKLEYLILLMSIGLIYL